MSKRKPNPKRPGRGTKGVHNPLLRQDMQGRHYRVCEFNVQPVLLFFDADGQEDGRRPAELSLTVPPSAFKKSLPEIIEKAGLAMEGGKPK